MLPRCIFCALGIVCAAPLLLNAQSPNTPPPTNRPGTAAAEQFGQEYDITVLTLSFAAKEVCHA
ncbi:MAG: hypothetical protein WAL75_01535 [Terracidiphilus sp.]